ncbi:MAG TPA: tRNA pseudouridine(55) synthase TruB [Propionibacteriaceae bacterium]|jgi:tRNA pseudouridine55 synthase
MTATTPKAERAAAAAGIAVIDKPQGWTSHQVVGRVRRLAGTRKVGHAGTLDPLATGVLVVGIERATKLLGHLTLTDKEYLATIRLGISTVTDDSEGEPTTMVGAAEVSDTLVERALEPLRGQILQVPSSVSAVKVAGVRSYARVRAGEDVILQPRAVTVTRLEMLNCRPATAADLAVVDVDVLVECTSGTYVRALARDLGAALGVGGHLTALRRTRVGPFDLSMAQTLDDAAAGLDIVDMAQVARRCFPIRVLDDEQAAHVRHGRRLPGQRMLADPTALLAESGELLALYRPSGSDAVAVSVFAAPATALAEQQHD